jgi:hypothetical protein
MGDSFLRVRAVGHSQPADSYYATGLRVVHDLVGCQNSVRTPGSTCFAGGTEVLTPHRVLAGEPEDHGAKRRLKRRPARPAVRMGPAAGDQLAVPAQQRRRLDRKLDQAVLGSERLHAAFSARSARFSFGCRACRRRIVSSWRRTRISSSFERDGRPSSQTSANKFRTTR